MTDVMGVEACCPGGPCPVMSLASARTLGLFSPRSARMHSCSQGRRSTLRALVCNAEASEPLEGSVRPQAPIFFSAAMPGSSSLFCSSEARRPAHTLKLGLPAHIFSTY